MSVLRIFLADDHPIVLSGLKNLIRSQEDLELVGEAENGMRALDLIRQLTPDIAVLDVSMPQLNGIAVARQLVKESSPVRVIILTVHEDRTYVNQALQSGVRGYMLKRSLAENLIQAIHAVARKGTYVDPAIAGQMFSPHDATPGNVHRVVSALLTAREGAVLRLIALGQTNKEIAHELQVSMKTVETFKARALEKIGLRTRAEIVRYAAIQGWFAGL